jgi:hypothetical protein
MNGKVKYTKGGNGYEITEINGVIGIRRVSITIENELIMMGG